MSEVSTDDPTTSADDVLRWIQEIEDYSAHRHAVLLAKGKRWKTSSYAGRAVTAVYGAAGAAAGIAALSGGGVLADSTALVVMAAGGGVAALASVFTSPPRSARHYDTAMDWETLKDDARHARVDETLTDLERCEQWKTLKARREVLDKKDRGLGAS